MNICKCRICESERQPRSRQYNIKLNISVLGRGMHVIEYVFRQGREKMTIEYFMNGPTRTKLEGRENAGIRRNSVKVSIFDLQNMITIFQETYLKFCIHLHVQKVSF